MAIDLQGIARLVGAADVGTSSVGAPVGQSAFTTTVKRAGEIAPFETVVRKAAEEQAKAAAPSVDTAPGAEAVRAKNAAKARKSFEAFALQAFIGSMLPKENTKLFGTGSAPADFLHRVARDARQSGRAAAVARWGAGVAGFQPKILKPRSFC